MKASNQWMSRPSDERYTSLPDMLTHFSAVQQRSLSTVVRTREVQITPNGLDDVRVIGKGLPDSEPTHHSFTQLARIADAPADFLRKLPAPLIADNVNYGLQFGSDNGRRVSRVDDEVGVLIDEGTGTFRAATGPKYGRVWNADVVHALIERFGDGVNGDWRVPGEFGQRVAITNGNTTLYASDRDMFVFLADEQNRIDLPGRRGDKGMARGFFLWNSEVGDKSLGIGTFLFDYVCCNRIVWGAEQYAEIRVRHTSGAPERFLSEVKPALLAYSQASAEPITTAIAAAREKKLGDDLDDFLASRFGKRQIANLKLVHESEEGRPIETVWDVVTAATAYARGIEHQDSRILVEREAGKLLKLAA
jgi:hypothetical protein